MINILLVDDHPILRQGLTGLLSLEDDMCVVGEAVDGPSGVEAALRLHPDLIIMDLRLPGMSGAEAIQQILARAANEANEWHPYVIVLTSFEDDDSITEAIEAGATGYMLKSAPPDEIVAAIRTTSQGRSVLAPSVAAALVRQMQRASVNRSLSPREAEVLTLVARGLSNTEIAETLFVEPSTVKTHIEHIFAKLGVARRVQAIAKAHEMGLVK